MAFRTSIVAIPLLLLGGTVAAQDDTTALPNQNQPELSGAIEGAALPDRRNPCKNNSPRCPDPMTVDTLNTPVSQNLPPPDAKPTGIKRKPAKTTYKVVLFQDGKLIQIRKKKRRPVRVGGNTFAAQPGDTPWMAQIQRPVFVRSLTARALQWDERQYCGGAKIAPNWIVTAAHCLNDSGLDIAKAGYRVRLGMHDIRAGRQGASYRIVRVIEHPNYGRPSRYANDIALIQFAADDQTAQAQRTWIETIAVDPDQVGVRKFGGQEAWFFGWGVTNTQSPSAGLRYGKIKLEADTGCSNYRIALCGRGLGATGSTQCHGDSGGPLVVHQGSEPILIGLVSHNTGSQRCGVNQKQGVFTRVAAYRGWIEGYTGRLAAPSRAIQRR